MKFGHIPLRYFCSANTKHKKECIAVMEINCYQEKESVSTSGMMNKIYIQHIGKHI